MQSSTATSCRSDNVIQKVPEQADLLRSIIEIVEKEYRKGNSSVTKEKYDSLLKLQELQKEAPVQIKPKAVSVDPYPSLYYKFNLPTTKGQPEQAKSQRRVKRPWTFKRIETKFISVLETIANILDNLHLLSRMPVFPKFLARLLKHTNQIWVLILVFLIRKTISQLLNVRRKEAKIQAELAILRSSSNYKLLENDKASGEENIFRKYEKIVKDLSFDKMMLKIELVGNFLDLTFNTIELKQWPVPDWFMSSLNMASMAMTIYRMNKDDEYVDDDISEDLI